MIVRMRSEMRVVLAIAAKDITDAFKNKSILSQIITLAFIIVLYRFLPLFSNGDALPRLALYDAANSHLVADLRESTEFDLVETTSQTALEDYVEDRDTVVLGLVLPPGLDARFDAGEGIDLEGYVVHWASASQIAKVKSFFEEELSELAGFPVRIHMEGNIVYVKPDSRGLGFLASLSAVLVLVIGGVFIVPLLMLEEKQNRTLDALLVSPADAVLVVVGKALSGAFYCLLAVAVVLALYRGLIVHWGLALLATVSGMLFAVGVGLLLGSLFEIKQQLTLWGFVMVNILGIPLFLSLMDELLPTGIVAILRVIPTVALMKVIRVSFSSQASLAIFGPELAIVLGSALLILAAVAYIVRKADR
jgi:ABC-2 type transport system permease protein